MDKYKKDREAAEVLVDRLVKLDEDNRAELLKWLDIYRKSQVNLHRDAAREVLILILMT